MENLAQPHQDEPNFCLVPLSDRQVCQNFRMTLPAVNTELEGSIGPLLNLALDAETVSRELMDPERLLSVTKGLIELAISLGSRQLWGTSETGQQLVGAMLLESRGRFSPWIPGNLGPVLLVDGVVAGTAGIETAAAHVRQLGAVRVEALIVGLLGVDAQTLHLSRITVLQAAETIRCASVRESESPHLRLPTLVAYSGLGPCR
jgi:hypothetical protein